MDQAVLEKLCEKLGGSMKPPYLEALLSENIPGLLERIQNLTRSSEPTLQELSWYAAQNNTQLALFGQRILHGRYTLILFILEEIKSRLEAINVAASTSSPAVLPR